jgi:hypothetical protein
MPVRPRYVVLRDRWDAEQVRVVYELVPREQMPKKSRENAVRAGLRTASQSEYPPALFGQRYRTMGEARRAANEVGLTPVSYQWLACLNRSK